MQCSLARASYNVTTRRKAGNQKWHVSDTVHFPNINTYNTYIYIYITPTGYYEQLQRKLVNK